MNRKPDGSKEELGGTSNGEKTLRLKKLVNFSRREIKEKIKGVWYPLKPGPQQKMSKGQEKQNGGKTSPTSRGLGTKNKDFY